MFPGVNPTMISYLLKSKLDELIDGKAPDGFTIKEKTEKKIHLVPKDREPLEGIAIKSLNLTVEYNGVEIILTHE